MTACEICDAPESLLGFPSIPKMSASVFRTSDRSTNGSSDVSVDGEKKEETKKEKKTKSSQIIIDDDAEWTWEYDLEPFVWMWHVEFGLK